MHNIFSTFTVYVFLNLVTADAPNEVLIVIISQKTKFHHELSENLRRDIFRQSQTTVGNQIVKVHILHEIINHPGDWTILMALPRLAIEDLNLVVTQTQWIILCEDMTSIALQPLLNKLSRENHTDVFYMGHGLHDQEATIIHHFAFFENPRMFPYPLMRSGVIFTVPLFKRVVEQVVKMRRPSTEFYIDASHELARFIMENVDVDVGRLVSTGAVEATKGFVTGYAVYASVDYIGISEKSYTLMQKRGKASNNVYFREAPYICPATTAGIIEPCLMYSTQLNSSISLPVNRKSIYFAIKTYHKFHQERIPAIENTWGPFTVHKRYFSDVEDEDIPTTATGIPNSETGHCLKTLSILKLALEDIENINQYQRNEPIQWLFLSDDDTLLSVAGVCDILGHFNPLDEVYLGERYGYRLYAEDGFNYITGGGGTVLSLPVIRKILKHCTCPTITAPDDMVLGFCLHTLQIKAIHSSRFHQARPVDYAPVLLRIEKPISFHKFWQLDPEAVYREWFANDDKHIVEVNTFPVKQGDVLSQKRSRRRKLEYKKQAKATDPIGSITQFSLLVGNKHSKNKHVDL